MDDGNEAIKEIAKVTGKSIDVVNGLGAFFNRMFGDYWKNKFGVRADQVFFFRVEQHYKARDKVEKNLKSKGITAVVPLPPWLADIVEETSLAETDDLLSLWANLITNGLDPDFTDRIERSYVSILAEFAPIDAICFDAIYSTLRHENKSHAPDAVQFPLNSVLQTLNRNGLGVSHNDIEVSLRNLLRLGLVRPGIERVEGMTLGGISPERYLDIEQFRPTLLGVRLFEAVL